MLYLLPAMGTNHELYQGEWQQLPETSFINWPHYDGEKSLTEIADKVIQENGITAQDWVGGSSLGGIVALEIFKKLGNPKVVLIGSAITSTEINSVLMLLAPLAHVTPIKFAQALTRKFNNHLIKMFCSSDARFIHATCLALRSWPGYQGDPSRILRLHGEKDPVVHCPASNCHILKNARHFIAVTQTKECVEMIKEERRCGSL